MFSIHSIRGKIPPSISSPTAHPGSTPRPASILDNRPRTGPPHRNLARPISSIDGVTGGGGGGGGSPNENQPPASLRANSMQRPEDGAIFPLPQFQEITEHPPASFSILVGIPDAFPMPQTIQSELQFNDGWHLTNLANYHCRIEWLLNEKLIAVLMALRFI